MYGWCQNLIDDQDYDGQKHFLEYVEPLIIYLFHFVLPPKFVSFPDVIKTSVKYFSNRMKKKDGRCKNCIISYDFFENLLPRLKKTDVDICLGHYLDYVLVLDCLIDGFWDNVAHQPQGHYVTDMEKDVQALINKNAGKRLYENE